MEAALNTHEAAASAGEPYSADAKIERVTWAASDGTFAIVRASDERHRSLTLAGELAHLEVGQHASIRGRWELHRRYGLQVRVKLAQPLEPRGAEGARLLLKKIPHIGPARAAELVARHGEGVFEHIDRDPVGAFRAISGVGEQHAHRAAHAWAEHRVGRELYAILAPHGLARFTSELLRLHGSRAIARIRSDPYALTRLEGVGFTSADHLARGLGVPAGDPRRAHAAARELLRLAEREGHSHLPIPELARRAAPLLGRKPADYELRGAEGTVTERGAMYRTSTHMTERIVAAELLRLVNAEPIIDRDPPAAALQGLSDAQASAFRTVFASRVSIVTGGPGTGKSTLARAICRAAHALRLRMLLCAPFGRAARRLTEVTDGCEAHTVHRALGWIPGLDPEHDPTNPLSADIVLLDEASTLSLDAAARLLAAIGDRTHLVLIGDADQLPAVGPGKLLAELIEAEACPTTRLIHVFRQAQQSLIVRAAHAVNSGQRPPERPEPGGRHDFFVHLRSDPQRAADDVVRLVSERIPTEFGLDPVNDVQVLSPTYRGPLGTDSLNQRLREVLSAGGERVCEGRFRVGDKLIATRNAYELGLRNGTVCVVAGKISESAELLLDTDMDERTAIPYEDTGILRPGFAIVVHRAIGTEVAAAVCVCHSSNPNILLTRHLLYTAMTRAHALCVLVGDQRGVDLALRRADAGERHSALGRRLTSP